MAYTKYTWKDGETVTDVKMNRMEEGISSIYAIEDTQSFYNALEIMDNEKNIILAIDKEGNILTKNFQSNNITTSPSNPSSSLKFPHYNFVGAPQAYVTEIDITGLALFESAAAVVAAYDELVAQYPLLLKRNADLGLDSSGTYSITHYTLGGMNPGIFSDRAHTTENQWDDTVYPRKRLLINGNIHGAAEKNSCLGCYLMVKEILESTEPWAMFIKNNLILDITPITNPWGYDNNTNLNYNGKNLNRTYVSNIQAENQYLIDLIADLIPKGLVAVIDFHNCASSTGYFVAKKSYSHWNYYAVLTAQLENIAHEAYVKANNDTDADFFFHLWAAGESGQLHAYVDSIGLLGCTFEVATKLGLKGALISKMLGINIINAFACYEGN